MSKLSSKLSLCFMLVAMLSTACSDEDSAPKNDTSWKLNNSAGADMNTAQDMPATPQDMDVTPPTPDMTVTPPVDMGGDEVDMRPPTPDMDVPPVPDMNPPTPDMDPANGCSRNTDCARNEVCCPEGFNGGSACTVQSQCLGGFFDGYCADDTDCGSGQECCEGSQLTQNRKFCGDRGCGMMQPGASCTTNNDCAATNQKCCPGFNGNTCADSCSFNNGICNSTTDAECDGKTCCNITFQGQSANLCLDRCP